MAPHWKDIGIELLEDKYASKLDIIEKNHPNDVERCCIEMFNHWLQVDVEASWDKLTDALEKKRLNTLAADIKKHVSKGTT